MYRSKKSTLDLSTTDLGCRESELLGDSARQMNSAINEAFAEIGVLSQLINAMKKNARRLRRTTQDLSDRPINDDQRQEFSECTRDLLDSAGKSQDRMQFADRMHHRLYDVQTNLKKLAELSQNREREAEQKSRGLGSLFRSVKPSAKSVSVEEELNLNTHTGLSSLWVAPKRRWRSESRTPTQNCSLSKATATSTTTKRGGRCRRRRWRQPKHRRIHLVLTRQFLEQHIFASAVLG